MLPDLPTYDVFGPAGSWRAEAIGIVAARTAAAAALDDGCDWAVIELAGAKVETASRCPVSGGVHYAGVQGRTLR